MCVYCVKTLVTICKYAGNLCVLLLANGGNIYVS